MEWGSIFKENSETMHEGFDQYYTRDYMFNGGKVKQLSMKYDLFGAVVENE